MRVPASGAAVSRICPLAVLLCVVVQSSYGSLTQASPRPSARPKLQPEPRFLPSSIPDPKPNSLPEASQLSSSNPSLRHKAQISPSPDPPPPFTPQFSSILFFKPLTSLPVSNASPKFKLQPPPKHNPKTKQGPASKSSPKRVSRNSSDNPKPSASNPDTFLSSNSKSNIKSSFASLSSPSYSNTKIVSKPSPDSEPSALSNPSSKFSSQFVKPSTLSEAADPKYNPHGRLSSQSNPRVHSKVRPSSQADINTSPNSRQLPELNPRASVRPQRNQTKVLDDSHHRPKRGWIWNQFFVLEEHIGPEPQYVGKLHSNSDKGDGTVRYILSGEGAGSVFIIDETTGDIHAAQSLDRERKPQYVLHARAVDRRTNRSLEAESEFIIKVQDVNDNAPTFPDGPFSATVPEMSDVGTSVFQVTASDADDPTYGNSAKIVYSILEGQPYFSVDPKTGVLRTAVSSMDRETRDRYMVVIQAKDMAGSVGGLSGSTTVNVTLSDVNDNPPKFSQKSYQLYVPESAPVGKAVGRIRANDEDEGENAAMVYTITNTDAAAIFSIGTDGDRREGIISLKQALNYENRKAHTLHIEGANAHVDSRFSHLGPFKDSTSLRVIVGDVDEPPIFSMDYYIMDVYENSPAGTQVGTVTAVDPDSTDSGVRYFIEKDEDRHLYFTIGVNSGVIRATQSLDREEMAWHNISVMAAEVDNPRLVSHVPVTIQVLDVNDNVPSIAGGGDDIIVCQSTRNGQVIQTLRPVDLDNFANGKFSFSLPADDAFNPNFTLKDNGDNTASILSHRRGLFGQDGEREVFQLPVVVGDGGEPPLSSTATLTLRVCVCERSGRGRGGGGNVCRAQAFLSSAGLSTGAFVAILLCIIILLAIVMLFAQLRSKKTSKEPLILSEEDVRENVVTYDDEGGGEEDTEAFDIAALRNPEAASSERTRKFHTYHGRTPRQQRLQRREANELEEEEEEEDEVDGDMAMAAVRRKKKRGKEDYGGEYSPELMEPAAWLMVGCVPRDVSQSAPCLAADGQDVIHRVIRRKVAECDTDTRGPPYDSLQTYAYEGRGSLAGSVSSLGLTDPVQDWELERQTLERLYGECLTIPTDPES